MSSVLSDFVAILISAISSLGQGVAVGIKDTVTALFLDTTGNATTLSTFGGVLAIFAGLALAIAITTRIYILVTSLGGNR